MEHPSVSLNENIDKNVEVPNSIIVGALDKLRQHNERGEIFTEQDWLSFENGIESLGFSKVEDEKKYLSSISLLHGNDVIVRRTEMKRLLADIEQSSVSNIKLHDSEPNATLLGRSAEGIGSALNSGFGWVVEGKVAGVVGFTNEHSNLSVDNILSTSPSHKKEHGELMRRVSGKLQKDDVIFTLFRIHKSVFPETLLEDGDYNDVGINNFIIRLYKKNRQSH